MELERTDGSEALEMTFVRMRPAVLKEIKALAKRAGKPPSTLMRAIIEEALKEGIHIVGEEKEPKRRATTH